VIAYSPDAEPARAYLLKAFNDIDVFVEDATCQNMYIRLINRVLAGRAHINQVFPLGSRDNVVASCSQDQGARARRRLYIIDADQDLMLGIPAPRLKHLYRLSAYCSENLLLSEHAAITLATEAKTNVAWPDMAISLALRPLLDQAVNTLAPLFVLYGIVQKLGLGLETVKYSVYRLLGDPSDPRTLSETLVRVRILSIIRQIRSHVPSRRYRSIRNTILRRVRRNRRHHSVYISGKTYLLPLVHLQLKKVAGLNDSFDHVKVRLAQHCELTIDRGLHRALRKAVK
jgi:hypothetical protein